MIIKGKISFLMFLIIREPTARSITGHRAPIVQVLLLSKGRRCLDFVSSANPSVIKTQANLNLISEVGKCSCPNAQQET